MLNQPKISNLPPNQKPSYIPLLFDWAPAPLAPKTGESTDFYSGAFTLVPKENGEINVVDRFSWTLSGPRARQLVPKVILTEYNQILSSELLGYLYNLRGVPSNLVAGAKTAAEAAAAAGRVIGAAVKSTPQPGEGLSTQVTSVYSEQKDREIEVSTAAAQNVGKYDGLNNVPSTLKSALDPYKGLYTVKQTGFRYVLPYVADKSMIGVSNTWGKSEDIKEGATQAGGGLMKLFSSLPDNQQAQAPQVSSGPKGKGFDIFGFIQGASSIYKGTTKATGSLGGGLAGPEAAEEIKAFRGASAVDSISLTFYLYNTFDSDIKSIQRNWDLCYLLTYQNLPNRIAKNLLTPPCLYDIEVPGYKKIPLAYLKDISISNVGSTRIINLKNGNVVTGVQNSFCKVIPEAYKVSLSFESVLKNTRNTFLYTAIPEAAISVLVEDPQTEEPGDE
jgi:hypothetical protein